MLPLNRFESRRSFLRNAVQSVASPFLLTVAITGCGGGHGHGSTEGTPDPNDSVYRAVPYGAPLSSENVFTGVAGDGTLFFNGAGASPPFFYRPGGSAAQTIAYTTPDGLYTSNYGVVLAVAANGNAVVALSNYPVNGTGINGTFLFTYATGAVTPLPDEIGQLDIVGLTDDGVIYTAKVSDLTLLVYSQNNAGVWAGAAGFAEDDRYTFAPTIGLSSKSTIGRTGIVPGSVRLRGAMATYPSLAAYVANGALVVLPSVNADLDAIAVCANRNGIVLGTSESYLDPTLWENGKPTEINLSTTTDTAIPVDLSASGVALIQLLPQSLTDTAKGAIWKNGQLFSVTAKLNSGSTQKLEPLALLDSGNLIVRTQILSGSTTSYQYYQLIPM